MHDSNRVTSLIADAAEVRAVCEAASRCSRVAIDTEADSFHSYYHKLCLIQLSFDGTHVLLDPLTLGREGLAPLVGLLADAGIVKVMHGADYDLRILDRDLSARVRGVRDTQVAAQLLGDATTGLAALSSRELGVELDKSLQRMDWSLRPLPPEALAYAANDTACLARLADRLEARLEGLGRVGWWLEECLAMEEIRWTAPTPDPLAFERVKGARRLRGEARDRFAALHAWREAVAASLDVPTFRVVRNEVLLALAGCGATTVEELAAVKGLGSGAVRRYGRQLVHLMASPPAAPAAVKSQHVRPDREFEQKVRTLRDVRDRVAAELGIAPGVLAPRGALEAVASACPAGPDEFARCLGRTWRSQVLEPAFAPVVASWTGRTEADHAPPL